MGLGQSYYLIALVSVAAAVVVVAREMHWTQELFRLCHIHYSEWTWSRIDEHLYAVY